MKQTCLAATLCAVALACATPPTPSPETAPSAPDELAASFGALTRTLTDVEAALRAAPAFDSEAERVGAYRHLLRAFSKGIEAEVLQDADYPFFRILDFWLREGGDNPDQRYAFAPIRGGETYRVWGELGSAARVELQLYAGRPWDGTGRSAGYLTFEEIELGDGGSFEIWVSADEREGNWLASPPDATTLFARHVYDEWSDARTGEIHIDRVGWEGRRKPAESAAELAARMRAAATMFGTTARTWPALVQRRYLDARPPNAVAPPYDTYALGGAKGRYMSGGHFDLEPGQVLLLRMPETRAHYQAVQLTDLWFASLEHANQISSLTARQSVAASDGAFYYVIAQEDPGYPNWLDAGALSRGTFLLRWDGVQGDLPEVQFPAARLLAVDELPDAIPGFEVVDEDERDRTRRARRRHLQLRSHR